MPAAFVCNGCGRLIAGVGPRCDACQTEHNRARNTNRVYDRPGEREAMAAVADRAAADRTIVCHLCASRQPPEVYLRPAGWVADHDRGQLQPAHAGCNAAKGGRTVEQFRATLAERLPWWQF